jgi:integrase
MASLVAVPSQTLSDWAIEWMGFSAFTLKASTVASYKSLLKTRILPTFGGAGLTDIDGLTIRRWVAEMSGAGLSASRIQQAHRLLGQLFSSAMECGFVDHNPCAGVKLPSMPRHETLFLNAQEVERLADAVPASYRALVNVLAYGGLRWGEGAALRRKWVNLDAARITVAESLSDVNGYLEFGDTKTNRTRNVALPTFLVEELRTHLARVVEAPDALIFTAPKGGPLRLANFRRRVWWPSLERAGLPHTLRIHDLRHTCATTLIGRGVHPKAIQHHLGHASIDITMDRYGHLLPDQFNEVAAQLDAAHTQGTASTADPKATLGQSRSA